MKTIRVDSRSREGPCFAPHANMDNDKRVVVKKADAAGWGLFFMWIGIAFLASVGWGVGLLGVGIIILGVQTVRRYLDVGVDGFSIFVGALFFFGGLWEIVGKAAPGTFVPILLIAAGSLMLLSAATRRPSHVR